MAFFGAIFLVIPSIFWRARVERINPLVALDAGVLFAAAGQIFGRIGNIINGDIIGYRSTLPWSTVYQNRSEEHTSELQSHLNLVCRLLLEKKKIKHKHTYSETL